LVEVSKTPASNAGVFLLFYRATGAPCVRARAISFGRDMKHEDRTYLGALDMDYLFG